MASNSLLTLSIITPSGKKYEDQIISAKFCDIKGYMTVLKNHAPTVGKIKRSIIEIKDINNNQFEFIIDSGLFSVADNHLKITTGFCIENNEEEKQKINKQREKSIAILNNNEHYSIEFKAELLLFQKLAQIKK